MKSNSEEGHSIKTWGNIVQVCSLLVGYYYPRCFTSVSLQNGKNDKKLSSVNGQIFWMAEGKLQPFKTPAPRQLSHGKVTVLCSLMSSLAISTLSLQNLALQPGPSPAQSSRKRRVSALGWGFLKKPLRNTDGRTGPCVLGLFFQKFHFSLNCFKTQRNKTSFEFGKEHNPMPHFTKNTNPRSHALETWTPGSRPCPALLPPH